MGDFVNFSYFFRISRLEGFLYSVAPHGDRKITGKTSENPVEHPPEEPRR